MINSRWLAWRDMTGDRLWAGEKGRSGLWACLAVLFWLALGVLYQSAFATPRLLMATALLFPPLLFAVIVPPPGQGLLRRYNIGLVATALLLLAILLLGWLAQFTWRGQTLRMLFG